MKKIYSAALIAMFVLAGCGGGGGDATAPVQPAPVPTPAPVQPPAPVPQAPSLNPATSANYTAGSESATVFEAFNAFRASMGLGPVAQDANIDLAAKNHAAYVANTPNNTDPHSEIAGTAGFTGVTALDRMRVAGYSGAGAGEVIAFNLTWPITKSNVVEILADSVYHRAAMMSQAFTHIGISPQNDVSPTYINMGYITQQKNSGDYVGVYPFNGQTGLSLTHYVESPNPFHLEMAMTSENMCTKTSYPISIATEASTALSVASFTVTEDGQTAPLDVRLITRATSAQDMNYLTANVAFIVGKVPFKKNTKYNVRFVGTATGSATGSASGLAIDKSWSFTTGTDLRGCL